MATVKVAYKELEITAKNLVGLKEYAQSVLTELAKSEADIEKTSSLHDNCFAATLDALADLEHAFTNYYNEIDFLIRQCNNAFEAFSTAEADSEKQAGVIKDLISLAGLEETVNASDVEVKSGETLDDVGKDNKRASSKKTSETWNRAFEDTDLDGVYDEIHGTKAKKADSIVGDTGEDKKEEVSEDATTDTDSNQSNNYNNNSSSGGGNNNRIQKRHKEVESIKDDKKDDKKKDKKEDKKEQKKTDPIEEKEVKEEEKKEEEKKEETKEEEKKEEPTPTPTPEPTPNPEPTPTPEPAPEPTPTPQPEDDVTYHTGGGYNDTDGYVPVTEPTEPIAPVVPEEENTTDGVILPEDVDEEIDSGIDTIIKSDEVKKIPVSNDPITTKKSSGGSSVIPIAAGLSAAAAAGLGAKAYMDHKKNNSEDNLDEFESEEWNGDESTDIDYGDSAKTEEYLEDDDYNTSIETEKYGARNNEELADLQ